MILETRALRQVLLLVCPGVKPTFHGGGKEARNLVNLLRMGDIFNILPPSINCLDSSVRT